MNALRHFVAWSPGKLAKDTAIVTGGMGLRAVSQALVFLITARVLGVEGYGSFVALLTLASVLSYFCGLGGHVLLVRDVARDSASFAAGWGYAISSLLVGTTMVFPIYLLASNWLVPQYIALSAIALLGVGELIFWPLANLASFAYQGYERMGRSSHMMLAPVVFRLMAALTLLALSVWEKLKFPLLTWCALYAVAMLVSACYVHYRVFRDLGAPRWGKAAHLRERIEEGIVFSFWGIAEKVYVDADKLMLARLNSLEVVGLYSAGYRVVDIVFLPLYALLSSAAPRFFRAGHVGVAGAWRYARRVAPIAIGYGSAVGLALFFAAPLLTSLLGEAYADAVEVVRWLCWLPLVSSPRLLLQYALATSGRHKVGMMAVAMGGSTNILINIGLIPTLGWQGAAVATYAAEILMAGAMACPVLHRPRSIRKEAPVKRR
ncbi:oligosaccharide flippase family protein [Methyloterricola oryzae]|uniref:oligosaccharide flippase family protein n=1 Tax=Methyloterricola oryzae TaxID=1495050 RepID=UPI0011AF0539|nr:oligosaccharide flippase family protein [Methyloterricola oryzae]